MAHNRVALILRGELVEDREVFRSKCQCYETLRERYGSYSWTEWIETWGATIETVWRPSEDRPIGAERD